MASGSMGTWGMVQPTSLPIPMAITWRSTTNLKSMLHFLKCGRGFLINHKDIPVAEQRCADWIISILCAMRYFPIDAFYRKNLASNYVNCCSQKQKAQKMVPG